MAINERRKIVAALKEYGWEFSGRSPSGKDTYTHPHFGILHPNFKTHEPRALKNLMQDIQYGMADPQTGQRPGRAETEDAASSIYDPQPREELARRLGITPSGVQWRHDHGTIKDGHRTCRQPAPTQGKGLPTYYYYQERVDEPDQTSVEATDDALSVAEALFEEASNENTKLTAQVAELTETNAQLEATLSKYRQGDSKYRRQLENLQGDVLSAEAERDQVARDLGDTREAYAAAKERITGLEEQLEAQRQELKQRATKRADAHAANNRCGELEAQVAELQRENDELRLLIEHDGIQPAPEPDPMHSLVAEMVIDAIPNGTKHDVRLREAARMLLAPYLTD